MPEPIVRSTTLEFYLARAKQARDECDAATLDHVRERCRRSEAAWTMLADKARRSEQLRIEEAERKAATAAQIKNEEHVQTAESTNPLAPTREPTTT